MVVAEGLLGLNSVGDLFIECQKPHAKDDLVLHLILGRCRIERAVEVLDQSLDTAQLVESDTVVIDSEEHLQASTERVLERVLLIQLLFSPQDVLAQLFVGHQLLAPAGKLCDDTAHLVDEEQVLHQQQTIERLIDVLLVFLGIQMEYVDAVLALL